VRSETKLKEFPIVTEEWRGMSQIKIVNVEDYESSREATSQLLRLAGFEVFEAQNGSEALELVSKSGLI